MPTYYLLPTTYYLPTTLYLLLLLLPTRGHAQTELPIQAPLTHATVFLEGAQPVRKATVDVPAGRSVLVFGGLTGQLDPETVQAAARAEGLLIIGVSHRLSFPEERVDENPDVVDLQERAERLDDKLRRLQTEVSILKEEEDLLRANRDLSGSETGLDAEDLERGVAYHRERITAIRRGQLALADSVRDNRAARRLVDQRLAELGRALERPAESEIVVTVEAERALTADFTVSYLVGKAGWAPEYDVRVDALDAPLDLRYRARVFQNSGEDWNDIKLTLSTGDPTRNHEAPELETWWLRPGRRFVQQAELRGRAIASNVTEIRGKITDEEGEPLIGASILVPGTSTGTVTDLDGNYVLQIPKGAEEVTISYTGFNTSVLPISGERIDASLDSDGLQLSEVVVTGYAVAGMEASDLSDYRREQRRLRSEAIADRRAKKVDASPAPVPTQTERRATTVAFTIELPYTIPSDGKPRRVDIKRYDVDADYRHFAAPKLSPEAFLTARVTDWERFDLVSGDVQLFFEGSYLGKSYLDADLTRDTLTFSLGPDAGVVVTREQDATYRSGGTFFGGRQVDRRGYRISVRNTKSAPIKLTLQDQTPVSADDDLDVERSLPAPALLDEATGIVTWQLLLPPQQEETVSFGYAVKHPKDKRVYLE